MSPEERKRWRKLLSQQEARVQVNPASIRQFGPFRGAVREGSAQGRVEIPGTTPASETSLGRMASALSGVSGLMNQYNDYLFKKEEIAQRGKALEFEKFSEGEKLKQVNQSIASIGLATKAIDERIIQQDLQNDRIALDNLDMYQDKLLADLDDEGLFNFATQLQDLQERQRKRVEAAEYEVSKDKDIRDDLLADERIHLATGARLSPLYKAEINQRVKDHLEGIKDSDIPLPTNKEDIKEMIRGWAEEWLEEKKINPSSSVARGLLESTQQFNLEVLEKHAESIMTAAEEKDSENTARDLNNAETATNSVFQFLPEDIDTTHIEAPASGEETEGLIKALGDLNPKQQSAVTRELKKHGVDLPTVVDSLLNPQIETEDPPLDPEGIGTNSPTSAQVRMGISIALQAVEKFTGDEEAANITNSVAFKNLIVKPQGRQIKTLNNLVAEAIAEKEPGILRALVNVPDMLDKLTWDGEKASEHRVGRDIITSLDRALVAVREDESRKATAREASMRINRDAISLALTMPTGEATASSFRNSVAAAFTGEGVPSSEELAETIRSSMPEHLKDSPELEEYLASFKQLSNAEAAVEADGLMGSVANHDEAQRKDELYSAKNQSWWRNRAKDSEMAVSLKGLLEDLDPNTPEYALANRILFLNQEAANGNRNSVTKLSGNAVAELSEVVDALNKEENKLATETITRLRKEARAEGRAVTSDEINNALRDAMEELWKSTPNVYHDFLKRRVKEDEDRRKRLRGFEEQRESFMQGVNEDRAAASALLSHRLGKKQQVLVVDTDGDGKPDSVVPDYAGPMSGEEISLRRQKGTKIGERKERREVQPAMLQLGGGRVEELYWNGPIKLESAAPETDPKMLTMSIDATKADEYLETRYIASAASAEANKATPAAQIQSIKNYLAETTSYHRHLKAGVKNYLSPSPWQREDLKAHVDLLGAPFQEPGAVLQKRLTILNEGEFKPGLFSWGVPFTDWTWSKGRKGQAGMITMEDYQTGEITRLKPFFTDLQTKTTRLYSNVVDAPTILSMVKKDAINSANLTALERKNRRHTIATAESLVLGEPSVAFKLAMREHNTTTKPHVTLSHGFIEMHQPLFEGLVYTDESKSKNAKDSIRYTQLSKEQVKTKLGASDEQLSDIALMFGFKNEKGEGDWDSFHESQMQRPEYKAMLKIGALRRK